MKKLMMASMVVCLSCSVSAASMVWVEQDAKNWTAVDAVWTTISGGASTPPGVDDYAYFVSTNEVTVDSAIEVKRLYIDRAVPGTTSIYTTPVASTVTVVSGGYLTVSSIAQFGVGIDGGTLNVAGGTVAFATSDRNGTWSVRLDGGYGANINITAGNVTVGSATIANTQVLSQANSKTVISISGTGLMEMLNGANFVFDAGDPLIRLSEGGILKYHGVDASADILDLAVAGKMEGILPLVVLSYTPDAVSNGVGWYFDGTDTYAFAVPEPATLAFLAIGGIGLARRRRKI